MIFNVKQNQFFFKIDVVNVDKLLFKNFLFSKEDYIQENKHWWIKDDKVILAETKFQYKHNYLIFLFFRLYSKEEGFVRKIK